MRIRTAIKRLQRLTPVFYITLLGATLSACGGSSSQLAVSTLEQQNWQHTITLDEFENKYLENDTDIESARKGSFDDHLSFLNRYIDFRLKVKDAIDRGYDKDPAIRGELRQYREQLAGPYLIEKEIIDKNLRDLYEKRQEELSASHILTLVSPSASPADTLRAYKKIMAALSRIRSGEPFDSVAVAYSEDPSVTRNNGQLGYFSGGMMVHQFETAAYATKTGQVSSPVRTRYGYHLIKVWARRPRTQDIRASHIMVSVSANAEPFDTLKAYQKAAEILGRLKRGEEFAQLSKDLSDDKASGAKGGDLGYFGLNRMVKPFEDAAFAIKTIGDLSPIIRTSFGYHIIKLTDRKAPASYEEEKEMLKRILQRDTEKLTQEKDRLITRLKKVYFYEENPAALGLIRSGLDSTTTIASLDKLDKKSLVTLYFKLDKSEIYTLDSLVQYLKQSIAKEEPLTPAMFDKLAIDYADQKVLDHEVNQLENRYEDFARLMKSYYDGVLLFKASEETVWKKAAVPEAEARAFYEKNKGSYKFEERVKLSEITVTDKNLADDLYAELTQGKRTRDILNAKMVASRRRKLQIQLRSVMRKTDTTSTIKRVKLEKELSELTVDDQPRSFEAIVKRYSLSHDSTGNAKSFLYQKDEFAIADDVFDQPKGSISEPIKLEDEYKIIRVDGREAARTKTFEEAKQEVSSQLQEEITKKLEKDWIDSLRAKTKISIFGDNLKQAFRGETKKNAAKLTKGN
ncbi:MAG: hypothetical protein HGB19_04910 [Chlorobiales bacterium]|nr:hypothetical protein [Chlorobiales bacterium]